MAPTPTGAPASLRARRWGRPGSTKNRAPIRDEGRRVASPIRRWIGIGLSVALAAAAGAAWRGFRHDPMPDGLAWGNGRIEATEVQIATKRPGRVREILVVQHAPPCFERFVRREDHRAMASMTFIDDMKQHVRRIGAVREVAHLVDYQDGGMCVRRQRVRELAGPKGGRHQVIVAKS